MGVDQKESYNMVEMTPRERVTQALNHQEPDRVPLALGGGTYGILDEVYLKLVQRLDLGEPVAPFRTGHSVSYMDDRLLEVLQTDTRYIWPGASPNSAKIITDQPDVRLDGFGQPWIRRGPYFHQGRGLLAEAEVDELESLVQWPDATEPRWTQGVGERARQLHENTNYFIIARMVTSYGPYLTAGQLRGVEQFFIDMALNEPFAQALVDRISRTIEELMQGYIQACGPYVDMVELPGDDYATEQGMAFSPDMFRRYFKPYIQRMIEIIKGYRPEIKVMLHCDGVYRAILPDLIEVGVDALNPIEALPAMDPAELKRDFGDQLSFLGAIDIRKALTGSQQDVIEEVKLRLKQLAPGGGYIVAATNHIQPDVPPENVITLYEAGRTYGSYPIQID
jgi:uroporphyrinogen decarboxylase